VLIDGRTDDRLPADDRGLAYGDGLFETMRLAEGRVPLLDLHLARLADGCRRLGLRTPEADVVQADLEGARTGRTEGVVKLILTRGSGGRGYAPPADPRERRIVSCHPLPIYPETHYSAGVRVRLCETPLGRNPALAGLKHLARLEQVLASREPAPADCAEGLMRDTEGRLVEGIRSNLFLVRSGGLVTPRLGECGVAGVLRRLVLEEAARLGLETREAAVSVEALAAADEIFLTSSIFGIWPVVSLLEPALEWPAGEVTRSLMRAVADRGVTAWAG
jgi:4-amino-4-deoxychorismate lyase